MSLQTSRTVSVGGLDREYWVYAPDSIGVAPPVMLFLHQEGAGDPDLSEQQTNLVQVAEESGFVLVLPIGAGTTGHETWDYNGATDVDFFLSLLTDLRELVQYDSRRVYGVGIGLGATMVHVLATVLSQKIAAIGTCSGAFVRPIQLARRPSRYVPVVMFHSQQDVFYPFGGGLGQDLFETPLTCSSIRDLVMFWVRNNRSPALPEIVSVGSGVLEQYGGIVESDRTKPVWLYLQSDGGHTWPGGQDILDGFGGEVDPTLDASRLIWDFVSRFRLDQPHQIFDFHLHGQDEDHTDSTEKLWRNKNSIARAPRL